MFQQVWFKKDIEKILSYGCDVICCDVEKLYLLKNAILIDPVAFVGNVKEAMNIICESHETINEEMMNSSFFNEIHEDIDLNISIIDKDTPINPIIDTGKLSIKISTQEN